MTDGVARVIAPAMLALFAAVGAVMGDRPLPVGIAVAGAVAVLAGAVAWRGLVGWPLAAALLLGAAGLLTLGHGGSANLVWMGFCVLAGWAALAAALPVALAVGAVLVVALVSEWTQQTEEPGWMAWIVGTAFTLVSCAFASRLRETVDQLRAAQHQLAERSRAEERSRIAGEVHDVIGHALTVSLLHIGSARLALDEDPDEARRALEEAERLARSSLEEVRATVGLMRTDAPGGTDPMPGAADIPSLVDSFRRAGVEVGLDLDDGVRSLGQARGLAAYRIVQEALTNATKHAPGEAVSVSARTGDGMVTLVVRNGGAPKSDADPGTGIRGMQDRAIAVGGELVAGPDSAASRGTGESAGPGWIVRARMPR